MKKHLAVIGLGLALAAGTVLGQDRYRWEPDGLGGYDIYDHNGNRVGRADNEGHGRDYQTYDIYDTYGNRTGKGHIYRDGGGYIYDNNGNRTGTLHSDKMRPRFYTPNN